ncbi:MAG TPA: hypothetical protein VLC91_02985 [Spongiibacteraceae bacterium]|nr:hypothetical protein [Spongiibacteraceae bacterium]
MNIGRRVLTQDGSLGIIVSVFGKTARICYLTPDERLTYIAETHLVSQLSLVPKTSK